MANNQAEWMATILGGKGKVLMDGGLAGAPISEQFDEELREVFKKYPGIEIVGYFTATMPPAPSSRASPACSPRIRKSTASCRRATAPAPSRR